MKPLSQGLFIVWIAHLIASSAFGSPSLQSTGPAFGENSGEVLSGEWQTAEEKTLALISYKKQSEMWRKRARTAYHSYDSYRQSHHGKIASRDLLEIKQLADHYSNQIWRPLWDLMDSSYYSLNLGLDVKIQTQRASYIETGVVRYVNSIGEVLEYAEDTVEGTAYETVRLNVYHINPLDQRGQLFLHEFKISFGAALMLMDNFMLGWEPYMNNKAIRRNLFYDLQGSKNDARRTVKAIWKSYRKYQNSEQWVAALDLYRQVRQVPQNSVLAISRPPADRLTHLIETSSTFKRLSDKSQRKSFMKQLAGEMKFAFMRHGDGLKHIRNQMTHVASKTFGNSAGLFQSRSGKLKNLPETEVQEIVNTLKPLDILFEKTPFRLTDRFIPGHYGHVAVWMGTESELRELGVWSQLPGLYQIAKKRHSYKGPSFQQAIRNGRHIIEALRPGVQMNSMRHFLDIDDLAVIRPKDCAGSGGGSNCLTRERKQKYLLEAFRQVGKKYDFNFDVNTESKVVCSEMAYRTFVDMDFSTTRTLGKHAISPDQVATMADDPSDPFKPVLLYHDGRFVPAEGKTLRKVFNLLLKKKYSAVEETLEFAELVP